MQPFLRAALCCVFLSVPCFADTRTDASRAAVGALRTYLAAAPDDRPKLADQDFAQTAITKQDVDVIRTMLAEDHVARIRKERQAEMKSGRVTVGDHAMPFFARKFGKKPRAGWSLYLSLHGGGGTAAQVNDRQWENQKRLYQLQEGIYVAPRAPTNTWNLWHQGHIDSLFDRLIENMVAFEDVDWNRVYVMGYSAGGDGVYQLAPRMADRWAAASMMAGHPNETSAIGLRNVPFTLQVGGNDAAYNRNKIAEQWKTKLSELHQKDPQGYQHFVKVYPGKGHWMDREDAVAIPWMAKHTRNPTPERIVWKQDDATHAQHFWLSVDKDNQIARSEIVAEVDGQTISVDSADVSKITVHLDDRFIDLDQPITLISGGNVLYQGTVQRTIASLAETLGKRGDPHLCFPSQMEVAIAAR